MTRSYVRQNRPSCARRLRHAPSRTQKQRRKCWLPQPVVPSQGEQCAELPVLANDGATAGIQDASDMATRLGPEVAPPCWSDTILSFACQQTSHPTTFAAFDSCKLVGHHPFLRMPANFASNHIRCFRQLQAGRTPSFPSRASKLRIQPHSLLSTVASWSDTILSFACQQTSHPITFAAFDSCEPVLVEHVEQQPLPVSFLSGFAVSAQNHGCAPTFPSDQTYTNPAGYLPVVKLEERPLLCDPLPDWSSTLVGFNLCPPPPICPASPFGTEIAAVAPTMAGTMGAWCEDWCSMLSAGDTGASSSQYKVAMAASSVMPTVSQVPVLASPCPAIVPLQQSPPFATKYEEESIEQLEPLHSATSPTIHDTSLGNLSSFGCYHATLQSASATAQSSATNSAPISFVTSAPPPLPPCPNPTNRCTRSIKRTPASSSASLKCNMSVCCTFPHLQ